MIYLDMDGVLANLEGFVSQRVFNKTPETLTQNEQTLLKKIFTQKERFLEHFPEGPASVFENLPPFPYNTTLIETILQFEHQYTILSRPFRLDILGTTHAKKVWIQKHLSAHPPKSILIVQDKSQDGRPKNNILIDDWDKFLQKWKAHGGHPIKLESSKFTCPKALKTYLEEEIKKCPFFKTKPPLTETNKQ